MLDEATINDFAIRAAKGNNGGEWATHYTETHKRYWRAFVRDIEAAIRAQISAQVPNSGIENGQHQPTSNRQNHLNAEEISEKP